MCRTVSGMCPYPVMVEKISHGSPTLFSSGAMRRCGTAPMAAIPFAPLFSAANTLLHKYAMHKQVLTIIEAFAIRGSWSIGLRTRRMEGISGGHMSQATRASIDNDRTRMSHDIISIGPLT
ncbi:hypothetical protein WP12_10825 [Sphingomonas sp. SRS2]|nr:hypothetical protein WP12_10825 [Sphingomonas sp. SRS2]